MIEQKKKAIAWQEKTVVIFRLLGDMVFPPKCPLCREAVDEAHALCTSCFQALRFISKPQCSICGEPFSYASTDSMLCGQCLTTRPPYSMARAPLVYDDVSRPLVTRFKYGDQPQLARVISRLMRQVGHEVLQGADFLIPVPLHWRRRVMRRYNQSEILAQHLGAATRLAVRADVLKRISATTPQVGLSRSQRKRNVARAFSVPSSFQQTLSGRVVVLVDDVITSGATLEACARTLMAAGAAEVRVLTLARRVMVD